MNNDQETVLAALFEHLQDKLPDVKTFGRRLRHWTQSGPMPALYLRHIGAEDQYAGGIQQVTTIEAEIWLYSDFGTDPDAVPDTGLNEFVCAVRAAFAPDDFRTGRFTLCGRAFWVRIEGRSEYEPGDQDGIGKALLPIRLTLP